ncbi:MAG TPA: radical SAM protein [Thermoanaerobaculia bacterium]|nr:radical SAM protein [Thermoanaerobaculia bacterium]
MPKSDLLPNASFFPLDGLRQRQFPPDGTLIDSVRGHLEQMAELAPGEQEALSLLLKSLSACNPSLLELGALPPEAVLSAEEVEVYRRLLAWPTTSARTLPKVLTLIVKGTRLCNLRCTYCRSWAEGKDQVMPFSVLARTIQAACTASGVGHVEFVWHGGETTLRPVSFYRKAMWLQERFRSPGLRIYNRIQTNGTTLDSDWLRFLKDYKFAVGISLDGPPEVHDLRRLDIHGRPTSERVRSGIERLKQDEIPFEIKMVVDDEVIALGAHRTLEYFLAIGVRQVSLLNVVPDGEPDRRLPGDYLEFSRYVDFLRDLFRLWWPTYVDRISFQEISDLIRRLEQGNGSFCVFGENCMGSIYTIEPQGEIAACDRFQGNSAFRFGNVLESDLADLLASPNLVSAQIQTDTDMDRASRCPWFRICQGGCPHDRYVRRHRSASSAEGCCGWSPLLADLAWALGQTNHGTTGSE